MNTQTLRASPQRRPEPRRRPDAVSRALAAFWAELGLPVLHDKAMAAFHDAHY